MKKGQSRGIQAALLSALFLGLAPIFGKQAILFGLSPLAVVALRTSMAAGLLLFIVLIKKREYLYIFPLGLAGCALAGTINGLGSLLYYMALGRLGASVGHFLYSLYPIFVVFWSFLDRQAPSRLTLLRIGLAMVAVVLITNTNGAAIDLVGVAMMLGASALYALHLPVNQRVLYEVPTPTVTLYTLIAMSIIVVPAYFLFDKQWPSEPVVWWPVIGLAMVTFLSRLALFLGVKHIGGMQTALLGLGELIITVSLGYLWLHETLSPPQWLGVVGLITSLLLVKFEERKPNKGPGGWLNWIRPPHQIPPDIPWGPHT
ncbi:MAG: hypothetical protein B6I38_02470 [Anaerolineaceae bacterium 4572_5.1]|nr:MAG: hypothetical protein B6I38_02470 [Anaerolineaceae bacterium 4572_5.1]